MAKPNDVINIIATTSHTGSAKTLMTDIRTWGAAGIQQWTGSDGSSVKVNYIHVGTNFPYSGSVNSTKLTRELSAHWDFDSTGSGENGLVDLSGTGHSGSFAGNTYISGGGLYGNAAHFDGSNDSITITPAITYAQGENFTFTCWFNLAGAGGGTWSRIVKSLYREDRMSIISFRNSNSKLRIDRDNSEDEADIGYDISSMKDEWHFLTVVRNAGGYSASLDANSTLTPIINAGSDYVEYELIGAAGPQAMSGSLDSLRFYDRQLSQPEITQIYNLNGQSATEPPHIFQVQLGDGRDGKIVFTKNTYSPLGQLSERNTITSSLKTKRQVPQNHTAGGEAGGGGPSG